MLIEKLKGSMQFEVEAVSWEQAIEKSAKLLVDSNKITTKYVSRMIESVEKNGAYIVIMPEVAMPHTQSEGDVNETCLAYTKFKSPIQFPGEMEASIFFCLAAENGEGHMELISELAMALMDEETIPKLLIAETEDEVIKILG